MIRIALCDDDKTVGSMVEDVLDNFANRSYFSLDVYEHPRKLYDNTLTDYQLFLLDIEMGETSGIQLAEHIRSQHADAIIIFLTSHRDYMDQIFHVQTFDYLLKPLDREKFYRCLNRSLTILENTNRYFTFSYNHAHYRLPLKEIIFFEKNGRNVHIHTSYETYTALLSTKEILAQVSQPFIQIHHSYIVNVTYFYKLEKQVLTLLQESQFINLPVSRKFKRHLQDTILMTLKNCNGY
ncbi:LytTR family DNA-binding domain-containing protein [Streptococcus suis]|nr:LytTR family DNA-binding domain-containing protein [Streptococcus suis]